MKKAELLKTVQDMLITNNISESDKLYLELTKLLEPKKGGGSSLEFEPKLDKDGNISELYCRWFKEYRAVDSFNKSTKSKTGYHYECKAAEVEWKKYTKCIKKLKDSLEAITNNILDEVITLEEGKIQREETNRKIATLEECRLNKVMFEDCPLECEELVGA
jgi:hypothetical protein